jgi:PhnB protein
VQATPFLLFPGTCAEAMAFYHSCLGGELELTRMRDTPMAAAMPAAAQDKVAHARLTSGRVDLSAADWMHPTRAPHAGNTVGVYLTGTDADIRRLFAKLAEGANPSLLDPLQALPFGLYGHLADRYGLHWFFRGEPGMNPDPRP